MRRNQLLINATWMNLKAHVKFKKPDTKSCVLYDFTYMTLWKRENPRVQKPDQSLPGAGGEGRERTAEGHQEIIWGD